MFAKRRYALARTDASDDHRGKLTRWCHPRPPFRLVASLQTFVRSIQSVCLEGVGVKARRTASFQIWKHKISRKILSLFLSSRKPSEARLSEIYTAIPQNPAQGCRSRSGVRDRCFFVGRIWGKDPLGGNYGDGAAFIAGYVFLFMVLPAFVLAYIGRWALCPQPFL
jgi:hypothetical protein